MPIHFAPAIRALEEALEAEGLIVTLDSAGVKDKKAVEVAGIVLGKVIPVQQVRIIRGHKYTAG